MTHIHILLSTCTCRDEKLRENKKIEKKKIEIEKRDTKHSLTSRMGHTGQIMDFIILRWIVDSLLLGAEERRGVNHRV